MKAVLFDFGGTIDTDGVHWSEKFWEYYQQFGVGVEKKDVEQAFVQSENMIMQYADLQKLTFYQTLHKQVALQFAVLKIEGEGMLLKEMVDACYQDVKRVIEKAWKILNELQPLYKLGLVSNFYGNLEVVCKEFRLDQLFGAMIDSTVVGIKKPNPAIFQLALNKLGVKGNSSYVVGDSYDRDVIPAKQLGCTTIWLKGKSWTTPPSTDAADYTIQKFEEIKKILL